MTTPCVFAVVVATVGAGARGVAFAGGVAGGTGGVAGGDSGADLVDWYTARSTEATTQAHINNTDATIASGCIFCELYSPTSTEKIVTQPSFRVAPFFLGFLFTIALLGRALRMPCAIFYF